MIQRFPNSRWLILLLALPAGLFDAWVGWDWTVGQQELASDQEHLAVCEELGGRIEIIRDAPVKVDETARTGDALAKLIESAAQQAGVDADRIVHVAPAEPRRLGDSPYLEQATAIELREVTLRQLIEMTLAIGRLAPRLKVGSASLRTPPGEPIQGDTRELWNVQLVLTAHIYSPKTAPAP